MCYSRMLLTVLLLAIVALAITGCGGTSATFPFEYDVVWNAAVGVAVAWTPDIISDEKHPYYVSCTRTNLSKTEEIKYDLKVTKDLNIFARRPSTKISVSIRQTKPKQVRFTQMERDFIEKVADRLFKAPPPG